MESLVQTALRTTLAERTARFASINRREGPLGPPVRMMTFETAGVADLAARRAIVKSSRRQRWLARRVATRWTGSKPIYVLFDGAALSVSVAGRWGEPSRDELSHHALRNPMGLSLLDLVRPESLIEVDELGEEEVGGAPAARYGLRLDVDRIHWSDPDEQFQPGRFGSAAISRRMHPDPGPKGVLAAQVWIDGAGRFVRFSYCLAAESHRKHGKAPWPTTELWDFGVPPELSDWRSQPVIDPDTLAFPDTERPRLRGRRAARAG